MSDDVRELEAALDLSNEDKNRMRSTIAKLRAQLAEVEAQAAAMREVLERVKHNVYEPLVNDTLAPDAGRALLAVVNAARVAAPGVHHAFTCTAKSGDPKCSCGLDDLEEALDAMPRLP